MFLFAVSSHFLLFLLSQVSNWFANARRRLKNTVRQPDLSWALRIKLYNKYVQGNAERLSVSSEDSCSDGTAQLQLHSNSSLFQEATKNWQLFCQYFLYLFSNFSFYLKQQCYLIFVCGPQGWELFQKLRKQKP